MGSNIELGAKMIETKVMDINAKDKKAVFLERSFKVSDREDNCL